MANNFKKGEMRNRVAVEGRDVLGAKWSVEVNDSVGCLEG
jgi:hypothetical protein